MSTATFGVILSGSLLLQVGYFRRSKTVKGKRLPTICKEVCFGAGLLFAEYFSDLSVD